MSQCQVLKCACRVLVPILTLLMFSFVFLMFFYFAHFPSVSLFISLWFLYTLVPLSSVSLVVIGSNHG